MAAARPRTFDDVLAPHGPLVRRIAERLREIARDTLPAAHEGIYGGAKVGMALYSLDHEHDVVCGIQPAADRCILYVHRVTADDSTSLRIEGKGKSNRHVKFRHPDELDPAAIRALLELSVARRA